MFKTLFHNSTFSSKTIVRDFLLWLVSLVVLVVVGAEFGYYIYSAHRTEAKVSERAEVLIDELSSLLSAHLYTHDIEGIKGICRSYSMISDINGIRVMDDKRVLLFDTIQGDSENLLRERDIRLNGRILGRVSLVVFDNCYYESRRQTLMAILFVGLFMLVVLVGGIHIVMRYILIKPLQQFNRGLFEIAEGNYSTRLHEVIHTDLNASVDAVNTMAAHIEKVVGQLSVARDFLKNVLNAMPSIIIVVDSRCRVMNLNHAAVNCSGKKYQECLGRAVADIFPGMESRMIENILESIVQGKSISIEQKNCKILGNKRAAEITVFPLRTGTFDAAVVRVDDITSRIRLQEVMVQTEKMLSVGGLGAGMAHEINNPLGGILQATQNIERRLSPELGKNVEVARQYGIEFDGLVRYLTDRQVFTMLTGIRDAGQRAAQIVQNMLQFSRRSYASMESCVLADILDRVLELANNDYDLRRKYDFRNFRIVRNYERDIEIVCSRGEIEQVFLNLCKNAAQSYGPIDSHLEGVPEIVITAYREDSSVVVEVADNGQGIAEEIQKRIFEPFFTTKKVGQGTGLGLAVSFFIIVDQHNGELSVDSSPGQGATFTVKLPG